jgi:surface protein
MLGRNGNIAYVRYDHQGRIVAGGPIISAKPPKVGNWQAVSNVIGTNSTGSSGTNVLRAFVRIDYFNRVVPSSLVLLTKEPGDNNSQTTWLEINAQYRGNGITTTTTTTLPPVSTTTSTTTAEPIVILDCNIHWNSYNLCTNGPGVVNIDFVANPGTTSVCNATYLYTNLMPDAYTDGRLIYIREVGSSLIRLGEVTDDQTRVVFEDNVCVDCSTVITTSTTSTSSTSTTSTSTSTTTAVPTTSTTTTQAVYSFYTNLIPNYTSGCIACTNYPNGPFVTFYSNVSTLTLGSVLYNDPALTSPYSGVNDAWFATDNNGIISSIRIAASTGVIFENPQPCTECTTTTTTIAPTTTTTTTVSPNAMILQFSIDSNGGSLSLPYFSGDANLTGTIDWGDGTTSANTYANRTHIYANAGVYDVTLSGTAYNFSFYNYSDATNRQKLKDIKQWGTFIIGGYNNTFGGCTNLSGVSATDSPILGSLAPSLFFECSSLGTTTTNIGHWDLSSTTVINQMFYGCSNFNVDISSWNVSNVTTMQGMFFNTPFNQNIGGWDVSSVTTMASMFLFASAFNQNISGWDVSNVTNMNTMFGEARAFNQDLSGWCVTNIPSQPAGFLDGAIAWSLPKPVWGTCPP